MLLGTQLKIWPVSIVDIVIKQQIYKVYMFLMTSYSSLGIN